MPSAIDEAEYLEADEGNIGWCPDCAEFTRPCTEPDAVDYDCPQCGGSHVMGAAEALLAGKIVIE